MNKEVKDIIDGIKKSVEVYEKIESPKDDLVLRINCYCVKLLLDYIKQLETNRDKAIEFLKENALYDKENNDFNDDLFYGDCKVLLNILKEVK